MIYVDFRLGFAIIKLFLLTSASQGNNAQMYVIAKSILCEILQVVVNEEGRKQHCTVLHFNNVNSHHVCQKCEHSLGKVV